MKTLELPASRDNINRVISEVEQFLDDYKCPAKIKSVILIAVEEIIVNIVNYAYREENGKARVDFQVTGTPKTFCMSFRDWGVHYNPLEKEDPDITLSAEEREIGGLGIYLVKQTMDDVSYSNEEGCNCLTIKKIIEE